MVTSIGASLPDGFLNLAAQSCRPGVYAAASAAADLEAAPPDADVSRRCCRAFETLSGGDRTISSATAVRPFLSGSEDDTLRKASFVEFSCHAADIDWALRRVQTDGALSVGLEEFTRFFAALCAAACLPMSMAGERLGEGAEDDVPELVRELIGGGGEGARVRQVR